MRLRSKDDFKSLKGGRRINSENLRVLYSRNHLDHARLGMAVSRKYGNAVQRNRLKRRIREIFRRHEIRAFAFDILVYPAAGVSVETPVDRLIDELIQGFARIIRQERRKS